MENRVVFIIPSSRDQFLRNFRFMRKWPAWVVDELILRIPLFKLARVTGIKTPFGQTEGVFISANLTAAQMRQLPEEIVLRKIIGACRKGARLGARIASLGAMAELIGDAGGIIARNLKIAVTTGASFTVAAALEGCRRLVELMGSNLEDTEVMILGAGCSVGGACARFMAREGVDYLTLAVDDPYRVEAIARRIMLESGVSCKVSAYSGRAVGRSDLIVVVNCTAAALLEPADLKTGAVVFNLSGMPDLSFRLARSRNDVLVVDGILIKVPGNLRGSLNPEFPPGTVSDRMVEALLLALEGRFENYSLGRELRVEKMVEIKRLADKHGFIPSGFLSAERCLSESDIRVINQNALRRKRFLERTV